MLIIFLAHLLFVGVEGQTVAPPQQAHNSAAEHRLVDIILARHRNSTAAWDTATVRPWDTKLVLNVTLIPGGPILSDSHASRRAASISVSAMRDNNEACDKLLADVVSVSSPPTAHCPDGFQDCYLWYRPDDTGPAVMRFRMDTFVFTVTAPTRRATELLSIVVSHAVRSSPPPSGT